MKHFIILTLVILFSGCAQKYVMNNCMRVFDKQGKQVDSWVCER